MPRRKSFWTLLAAATASLFGASAVGCDWYSTCYAPMPPHRTTSPAATRTSDRLKARQEFQNNGILSVDIVDKLHKLDTKGA